MPSLKKSDCVELFRWTKSEVLRHCGRVLIFGVSLSWKFC